MESVVRKNRLTMLVSLVLLVGFLVNSFASYYASKAALRQEIITGALPLSSDTLYSEIQSDLVRPVLVSSVMANDTFLKDWVTNGERNVEAITNFLTEIRDRYGAFTSFFVSDATRNYYHPNGIVQQVSQDDPADTWYFRVREMQAPYETNVDYDQANRNNLTIFINYKVLDNKGNFLGVTGVGLSVSTVSTLLRDYRKRYDRNVYFVQPSGDLVTTGLQEEHQSRNLLKDPSMREMVEVALSKPQASVEYKRGHETILLNSRFIPELNWFLFIEQEEGKSLADVRNTLFLNIFVCIAVTILVALAINYAVRLYQVRLERMATTDDLTGLWNRQAFEIMFPQAVREIIRRKEPMSAILLDIDKFKDVNDQYGHLAGDRAITAIGKLTTQALRDSDQVFRWGGEEFLAILHNCTQDQAFKLAESIRNAVAETVIDCDGNDIQLTVSLGVTEYKVDEDRDSLLRRVDRGLYAAKEGGRNRTEVWSS